MRELVDKGILFVLCIPTLVAMEGTALPAAVALIAVACTCLSGILTVGYAGPYRGISHAGADCAGFLRLYPVGGL